MNIRKRTAHTSKSCSNIIILLFSSFAFCIKFINYKTWSGPFTFFISSATTKICCNLTAKRMKLTTCNSISGTFRDCSIQNRCNLAAIFILSMRCYKGPFCPVPRQRILCNTLRNFLKTLVYILDICIKSRKSTSNIIIASFFCCAIFRNLR
ncbi:Uncharacterised protein [Candidatus Bartonella washoeensis]|nr:Uncharacterised protein [Bartonella washoeensis]